ncbi:MAG: RNA-binding protein [Gemmatimonadetes bacterium]|jgi:RNA recognition motif-containing protein|nr:RNA-binding protein [Gemmatimonadota bacterium]MBT5057197.1 RNA-binding protein [Gemmatimonadota bacterium]MBT5143176.1 RNA-binding protein [Gemmatimonadota bacterium]MBT5590754.1 RNA-binding protein [Gemmatimonadota bacterium]MBT5963583.1 RNA-binding protein [Gemmatimonadota bacterium]
MKVSVSNLAGEATEEDLRQLFELFGSVTSVTMHRSGARCIVDMPSRAAAKEAITGLAGQELLGHEMEVEVAREPGKGGAAGGARGGRRRKRR